MQSPGTPFQGYAAPAPATPMALPPPPAGSPLPWPPPPTGAPSAQVPVSDIEQMLRPQGLFQNRLPPPVDWQQPYPPAPGAYPPGGQYPQGSPYPGGQYPQGGPYPAGGPQQYPPGGQYPQGGPQQYPQGGQYPPGQYPVTDAFQQAGPPQPWPQAATGAISVAGAPALPAGPGQAGAGYPAGGQYPQGSGYPGPYGNGQYPGAQFGQDQVPPGQFGPGVQYGPDGTPLGGGPGGPGLQGRLPFKRPKGPLVPVAVGVGVVIVVVAALTLSSQGGSSSNTAGNGTASGAAPTSSSTGTTALTQHQAATGLAGLLSQSGTDHADVNTAVTNVEGCKGLTADAQTLAKAAANRGSLLAKLAQLPGRSALPASMVSDLTTGWQASATVDADLARWATTEAAHCKKNDFKNPAYSASLPYDSKATNGKTAFVRQWNGLARKYALAVYQPSQI